MRPNHLFVSSCDGGLYDTRVDQWSSKRPLRANYERHHTKIDSVADFKATLRAGPYAWPGGYPLFFITSDGAALSFDAARSEARLIMEAIADNSRSGWDVVACAINYEDMELFCNHTNQRIECAYETEETDNAVS